MDKHSSLLQTKITAVKSFITLGPGEVESFCRWFSIERLRRLRPSVRRHQCGRMRLPSAEVSWCQRYNAFFLRH